MPQIPFPLMIIQVLTVNIEYFRHLNDYFICIFEYQTKKFKYSVRIDKWHHSFVYLFVIRYLNKKKTRHIL